MVLIKHNYLKSDIFFNPIFIPGFSESRFFTVKVFRVQVFRVWLQGPGSGSGFRVRVQSPGSWSRVRVQVVEVAIKM